MAAYFYTYTGKKNISVDDFIDPSNRLFFKKPTIREFLTFDNKTGINNAKRIFDVYDQIEQIEYANDYVSYNLPYIKPGTNLILQTDSITIESFLLYGSNQFLTQGDFQTYWSDSYNNLINDPLYVKVDKLTRTGLRTDVQLINENLKIWIWIAAKNKIYDITAFVSRVNTAKNFDVGTFSLSIDPVMVSQDDSQSDLSNFFDTGLDVINVFPLFNQKDGQTNDFFQTNLQMNDLVFIRYETLALEPNPINKERTFDITPNQLPGQVWDMIGLIDSVSVTHNNEGTDRLIQVNGRDLMKLLIDDASYFIPTVFRNGSDLSFVWGGDEDEDYFKRNFIGGAYQFYFSYALKSIRDILGFIINHLTNLQIVDDDLLNVYADRVSTRYNVTGADKKYIQSLAVKGIWKIIKLYVDPVIDERRVADDAIANPDGTLLAYVNRVCQKPFVEFYGDTNGDQFDFIVRQQPFTAEAIRSIIGSGAIVDQEEPVNGGYINVLEKDVISYTLEWDTRYYSWYQIQAQNLFIGNSDSASLSVVPIIFLPEYNKKFGNKRMIIQDNYLSSKSLKGDEDSKSLNIGTFAEIVLNDLKYVIDINSYLPFTRRGTITIVGDRRIKIGTFIRFAQTNELFYVLAVSNSATFIRGSIERVTTLTVERGMVFDYIKGPLEPKGFPPLNAGKLGTQDRNAVVAQQISYSYFNIVDTNLIISSIIRNLRGFSGTTTSRNISTSFGVNTDIFRFFEQRQQFKQ